MEDRKAPVDQRILAFIIDYVAMCFVEFIVTGIVIASLLHFDFREIQSKVLLRGVIVGTAISFAIFIFKDIFNGASVGRRVIGIAVRVSDDHQKTPGLDKLILRNLLLAVWPIEALAFFISGDKRKRLGDILFHTEVVKVPKS